MLRPLSKSNVVVALLLAVLVAVGYAPVANLSFLADDYTIIPGVLTQPEHRDVDWNAILRYFYTPIFGIQPLYRPMYSLSVALDYSLYGTEPLGYHLTNLVLHVISSFFVYLVALELVPGERKREISLTAGVLFALYPVHPEAVTWIAGRVDVICAVFFLPALLFFLRWLRTEHRLYLALSLAFFVLSLMSKETAMTLPAVLFLCAIYKKQGLRGALYKTLPFVVLLGAYLLFRAYILSGLEPMPWLTKDVPARRILSGFLYRTMHMFIPINLEILSPGLQSILHPVLAFWSILVVITASVLIAAVYLLGRAKEKLPILLLALYTVTLLPVYNALRQDPTLTDSRWSYIPSVFLAIFIAYVLWRVLAGQRRWALAASAFVCLAFFVILVANNQVWLEAEEIKREVLAGERTTEIQNIRHKGAFVFFFEEQAQAANSPPFKEP